MQIEVDGNVSFENISQMKNAGASIFVSGTSAVFSKDFTLEQAIYKTKELI